MTVDFWYHVDTTHGSYNAMKASAAIEHSKGAPDAVLSINTKKDGLEALVKVRTVDGTFSPGWETAPFVFRKFTVADHDEALSLVVNSSWEDRNAE